MKIKPRLLVAVAAAALALGFGALDAHAADLSALDGAEVVSDETMKDMRGGFISIGGLQIGFGATVRTYADGALALITQLTWTPNGVIAHSTTGELGARIDASIAQQLAGLGVAGLQGGDGVAVFGPTGATAVIHRVNDGGVQNFIINTQNDVAFRQEIDVELVLPGFEVMQQGMSLDQMGLHLRDDLAAAAMSFR
jgi:hypothetical protein